MTIFVWCISAVTRPLYKYISPKALQANWLSIRKQSAANNLLATVKSNAYGHGLVNVVQALGNLPNGYAVIEFADAVCIRRAAATLPIILMQGMFQQSDVDSIALHQLTPVIHSRWQLDMLKLLPNKSSITVYVKVNTGMNRLGFQPQEVQSVIEQLQRITAINKIVLATHFANADSRNGLKKPLEIFTQLRQQHPTLEVSIGNSATSLLHDNIEDDWARIGIALYGTSPAPSWKHRKALKLVPVMTLMAKLMAVYSVGAGEMVGYGKNFIAPSDMTIGIASIGYGDGYPRCKNLYVQCQGQECPVIGQVSMEMIAIDLTAIKNPKVGAAITLWGDAPNIDDIASIANTISYNLLTATSPLPAVVK